jgi:tetratricopeptide (TPR) repeat protein
VTQNDVPALIEGVRARAARVMGEEKASKLAVALASTRGPILKNGHSLASEAAAKLLASGKLRQAEKAYLELVAKHGDLASYVGLGRTLASLEDVPAALTTLRDGAAKFAKTGDRATAVSLLAEAVALAPMDLAAHRRLAAALANQGDLHGAVEEYGRFVDVALMTGDSRRALLELAYGRETLGDLPGLAALVDKVTAQHARSDAPQPPRVAPVRQQIATPVAKPVLAPAPAPVPTPAVAPMTSAAPMTKKAETPKVEPVLKPAGPLMARTRPAASETAVVIKGATTVTQPSRADDGSAVDVLARAGVLKSVAAKTPQTPPQRPVMDIEKHLATLLTSGSGIEAAATVASRASLLTGAHDTRATEAVLDAARRLLALGKLQSASDVLLDFIGHGFTDREAQRLLIEVDCALGRRDYAKEKCDLLSRAYRLDGQTATAEDVERLARII